MVQTERIAHAMCWGGSMLQMLKKSKEAAVVGVHLNCIQLVGLNQLFVFKQISPN